MKLEVKHLKFGYLKDSGPIFKDFSISVREGEFVSIIGPSGCGKSTFLNLLAGILTGYEGDIYIDGERVSGISEHFAYMPQNDLLLPWRTVLDNVCLYSEIHHNKKAVVRQALDRMAQFGLKGYEDSYPDELSGGMRQRAAFLRTVLCEADILLLDEPFGALDVITRAGLQDWLYKLCKELRKTVLLVTHDTDEAIYLSDRILVLGHAGEGIRDELRITETERTREWLYANGDLRTEIYGLISSDQDARQD
ncbi:MAG: ABC transporter ATP-binding protein [Lachnospiraceae bacterium]|nr:ABC transporter ATP-binding protein [Lachnospiraceae bacterium]